MADLRIEKDKAERLVALILRDEAKMSPEAANKLALKMCDRLQAAMAMPVKPGLRGYRMIQSFPPWGQRDEFNAKATAEAVRMELDDWAPMRLWELAYSFGRDLPDDIVV